MWPSLSGQVCTSKTAFALVSMWFYPLSLILASKDMEILMTICSSVYNIWHLFVFSACMGTAWIMAGGSIHLNTPPLPTPPWLLTPSCRPYWFSFTPIKTVARILLTAQIFMASKNLRLQKHTRCWGCREMIAPPWPRPIAQDLSNWQHMNVAVDVSPPVKAAGAVGHRRVWWFPHQQ